MCLSTEYHGFSISFIAVDEDQAEDLISALLAEA
jgi:hypothetical protein